MWVEFFEGRQLQGSKGRYYRPTDQQLLEGIHETNMRGYIHCIDSLTLNEENRLKKQVRTLKAEVNEVQLLKAQIEKQTEEMAHYRNQAAQFIEMISHLGPAIESLGSGKKDAGQDSFS